jgi:nucleotide-binding universal stress UspA family protein
VAEVLSTVPDDDRPPVVRVLADWGPAGPVLVRQSRQARLLVVGSRSRSQLTGMVLGSVALNCVVHASCPVMVVRRAPVVRAPDNR